MASKSQVTKPVVKLSGNGAVRVTQLRKAQSHMKPDTDMGTISMHQDKWATDIIMQGSRAMPNSRVPTMNGSLPRSLQAASTRASTVRAKLHSKAPTIGHAPPGSARGHQLTTSMRSQQADVHHGLCT